MSHQVVWTEKVTRFFEEKTKLTEFECRLLESRIAGMTVVQQSFYFCKSISSIEKSIKLLKTKYDAVQVEYPDTLKPRRNSVYEQQMDEH